ncbi:MAG: hypothetical protein HUU01_08950 [Saprospiraceae bacterium]|nr:hypothetical protein [Saprospiraceae bacterium]
MQITFNNQTGFSPAEVYWTIVGKNKASQFAHITVDGNGNGSLVPMDVSDNIHDGYADYSYPLSQCSAINLPNNLYIDSARIYLSIGSSLPIKVHIDGYAPPSITNPSVAGYATIYDFCEFAFKPGKKENVYNQLNFNTSSVDLFSIPILANLSGGNLEKALIVGYEATRATIFSAIATCVDPNFKGLIIQDTSNTYSTDLRIISPANVFSTIVPHPVLQYFTTFFDAYIQALWTQYRSEALTVKIKDDVYTGRVDASNNFNFTDKTGKIVCTIPGLGSGSTTPPAITSLDVLGCRNSLAYGDDIQKNIQKYIAAAINRTVMDTLPNNQMGDSWCDLASQYYTNTHAPIHYYALILHNKSLLLNGVQACYAFSYDDVCEQSSSVVGQDTDGSLALSLTLPAW